MIIVRDISTHLIEPLFHRMGGKLIINLIINDVLPQFLWQTEVYYSLSNGHFHMGHSVADEASETAMARGPIIFRHTHRANVFFKVGHPTITVRILKYLEFKINGWYQHPKMKVYHIARACSVSLNKDS